MPLIEVNGMLKHWDQSVNHDPAHVTIALLGRFKGEIGENYRLLPIVPVTRTGIENQKWIGHLLEIFKLRVYTQALYFEIIKIGELEQVILRWCFLSDWNKYRLIDLT
jgi:hypothetical protein